MRGSSLLLASMSALLLALPAWAEQRYQARGLVLSVDAQKRTVVISHDSIPGFMDAMAMPFRVKDARELEKVRPATLVDFTLVVTKTSSYVSDLRVREFDSIEQDPDQSRRLKALDAALQAQAGGPPILENGQAVPDFTLVDQRGRAVKLSEFRGKVVAITFIYTRCPLPDYCFRLTNNFGRLQKRFQKRMGRDLVLLSVSFDPEHDTPEVLAKYAEVWKAEGDGWRFLSGPLGDVKRICGMFGMDFWPTEGLMTHSLHTVVLDREGTLVANLEGNQYSAGQLGDLVQATLSKTSTKKTPTKSK